jgi:hypothetical protein
MLDCSGKREIAFELLVMKQFLLAPHRLRLLVFAEQLPVDACDELFDDAKAAKSSASGKTKGQIVRRSHAGSSKAPCRRPVSHISIFSGARQISRAVTGC